MDNSLPKTPPTTLKRSFSTIGESDISIRLLRGQAPDNRAATPPPSRPNEVIESPQSIKRVHHSAKRTKNPPRHLAAPFPSPFFTLHVLTPTAAEKLSRPMKKPRNSAPSATSHFYQLQQPSKITGFSTMKSKRRYRKEIQHAFELPSSDDIDAPRLSLPNDDEDLMDLDDFSTTTPLVLDDLFMSSDD